MCRCTRSCFTCPICVGPLSVTSLETKPDPNLLSAPPSDSAPTSGPYALVCSYCLWSSTELGIKFDKPNSISSQLHKLRNGGATRLTPKERKERRKDPGYKPILVQGEDPLDPESHFAALKTFYQSQLSDPNSDSYGFGTSSSLGELGFSSSASLSRIMSLYTGGLLADKKAKNRVGAMREAITPDEGLQLCQLDETAQIARLKKVGWEGTASNGQMAEQMPAVTAGEVQMYGRGRFVDELRPVACLLRTKRSKRCPVCRHIISKPEAKVQTTRFRIRLVATNYVPSISIRRLNPSQTGAGGSSGGGSLSSLGDFLEPVKPAHFILTFKNPLFDAVKVTLATPAITPGRFASRVTVLCPEFEIDANTDVWDEALKDGSNKRDSKELRRPKTAAEESAAAAAGGGLQLEVGKIWERGRNWVSIVVEVVPASLRQPVDGGRVGPIREDEDVVEVPMFVRVEWETEAGGDDEIPGAGKKEGEGGKEGKEKRELAYWVVLGVGRIKQS